MSNYIIPLNQFHQPYVEHKLQREEPWHIIAYEAFLEHGIGTNEHQWFGEFNQGQLIGVIYHHQGLIHFIYEKAPDPHSSIYTFLTTYFPYFITHGKKEIISPIVQRIPFYQGVLQDECNFVLETPETKNIAKIALPWPVGVSIYLAQAQDFPHLLHLFKNSSFESQVDRSLITALISKKRVLVAVRDQQLVGSIMTLKESKQYSLIGDLFVQQKYRKLGLASILGQCMIQEQIRKGKKTCFYYSDSALKEFYSKASFVPIGTWVSYQLFRIR